MQKITVTLIAPDEADPAAFVAELSERARFTAVAIGTREETITRTVTVWARPEDITFVSAEPVPAVEPAAEVAS